MRRPIDNLASAIERADRALDASTCPVAELRSVLDKARAVLATPAPQLIRELAARHVEHLPDRAGRFHA